MQDEITVASFVKHPVVKVVTKLSRTVERPAGLSQLLNGNAFTIYTTSSSATLPRITDDHLSKYCTSRILFINLKPKIHQIKCSQEI